MLGDPLSMEDKHPSAVLPSTLLSLSALWDVPKKMAQLLHWHKGNSEETELKRLLRAADPDGWSCLLVRTEVLPQHGAVGPAGTPFLQSELDKLYTEETEELRENEKGWSLPGASLGSKASGMSSFFAPSSVSQQKDSRSPHWYFHTRHRHLHKRESSSATEDCLSAQTFCLPDVRHRFPIPLGKS